jgi:hypothetical protein
MNLHGPVAVRHGSKLKRAKTFQRNSTYQRVSDQAMRTEVRIANSAKSNGYFRVAAIPASGLQLRFYCAPAAFSARASSHV